MDSYLKENWTEDEVLALPLGEQDFFDRKSGKGIEKTKSNPKELSRFKTELAKDLSAFANSGGGYLIFGVRDNGSIDGVDEIYNGVERTREWLEKMIPTLIVYPLRDFNVLEAFPSNPTQIPQGKTILVINIGDSKLAPHQAFDSKIYYHRTGSHSLPAGHHYISLMFGRSRFPSKEVAESWLHRVLNPLIDYLEHESENLDAKKRLWNHPESLIHFAGAYPPFKFLLESNSKVCSADILEQFFEFNSNIEELLKEHDEIIRLINKQFLQLYTEIRKLPFTDYFRNITTPEKLLEISAEDFGLKKYKPEELYAEIFSSTSSEVENLDFVATLVINKIKNWSGRHGFNTFWEIEGENFISFLQNPQLALFDQQIDKSYENCRSTNLEIIRRLKERRSSLSIEYGIPVR